MKKSYSIFLSTLFCFLFCSLSAQDAQLNAASRKVIIEGLRQSPVLIWWWLIGLRILFSRVMCSRGSK